MAEEDKNRPHGSRSTPNIASLPLSHDKLYINGGDTRYIIASHSPVRDSIFFLSATTLFSSHSLGQEEEESRESFLHIPHLTLYAVFRGFYWKEWGHLKVELPEDESSFLNSGEWILDGMEDLS